MRRAKQRALFCEGPPPGMGKAAAHGRLYCFPHVGGGASLYAPWRAVLAPRVAVVAVQLPGRESLLREAPFDRMEDIVDDVAQQLEQQDEQPYALFGHSMGALIAFEVARAIRRKGRPGPIRLFVSAAKAPHLKRKGPPRSTLPDAEFRAMLQDMGGTPEAVLQEEGLLAMFLPGLRGDFAAYDGYAYRPEPPLDCPVSVFGGLHDREVDPGHLQAWSDHTTQRIKIRMFSGGHFFVRTAASQVAKAILEDFQSREEPDCWESVTDDSPVGRLRRVAVWPTAARARP